MTNFDLENATANDRSVSGACILTSNSITSKVCWGVFFTLWSTSVASGRKKTNLSLGIRRSRALTSSLASLRGTEHRNTLRQHGRARIRRSRLAGECSTMVEKAYMEM